jgi:hypothetical protein
VTSPAPLTEAEKAAAEALFRCSETGGEYHADHWTIEDFADEARAVVAAVRGPIAAKALLDAAERVLDQADRVRVKFGSVHPSGWNRTYGLSEAASMLRADAQSLSLPASKETQQ